MKIRTLIVDDEPLARERIKRFLSSEPDIQVIGEIFDGLEAVSFIKTHKPDLVFLDVQIPELDGFGVIKEIGVSDMPVVIFVTAYDAYALRAFDVHALDYLLKPYSRERFQEALQRARLQLQRGVDEPPEHKLLSLLEDLGQGRKYLERLLIKSSGRIFFLRTEEIEWVESEGNYLRLHAGHEKPLLRETMNNLAAKLDPAKFFRIHRSILVNIDSIKELSPMFSGDYVVLLYNGTELTLTRNYREKFLESFNNYT